MNINILKLGLLFLGFISLVGCEKESVDNERPLIKVISPADDEHVLPGSDIHFVVEFSDNVALSSYKVNIHGAFDGHTHGVVRSHGSARSLTAQTSEEHVEFQKTWLENDFISLGEEPIAGKRTARVDHHLLKIPTTIAMSIDGEQKEMPLKEGHYHFIVYCTDESGLESFAAQEVFISYDADDHNHDHP